MGRQPGRLLCRFAGTTMRLILSLIIACRLKVLGTRIGSCWQGTIINAIHNGGNSAELQRIRNEHHGEPECVVEGRVLGWLAPTRGIWHTLYGKLARTYRICRAAIGDAWLKLPAVYTGKLFANIDAPWMQAHSLGKYVQRIRTPPYVSAKPDIYYRKLHHDGRRKGSEDTFLILCSDGLVDLHGGIPFPHIGKQANRWVQVVGKELDKELSERGERVNLALKLLRDAIGGEDMHLSSRILTVEMEERWIDDTTIIVQRFV